MAFRTTGYWKSMITPRSPSRSFALSTSQKVKQYTTTANAAASDRPHNKYSITGEYAPIYMLMGMLGAALCMAIHTAKQQLVHSPGVVISKKNRESISEADNPDQALASADKFLNKSFLRKVAHIQDNKRTLPDPSRPDPFTRPRTAETLKTVGVDPIRR
ncbi:uncharacterized protein LOC111281579 [Durio zibethinus]|uniref:Uncharacterized protein LOC111281579 n=1 Tax=Durio zibethinus TaxID=66656 RepID=A0A6P5X9G7_DURZI|nr:uncharacterized protein LOC111281579 [Durio zibethinus]